MFFIPRNWRRRWILARRGIPDALWEGTLTSLPVLGHLDVTDRGRLRELALLFLHEKSIEAAGGLDLDDAGRVRIAALACLPILNLGLDAYDGFVSVIVHPGEFIVRDREEIDEFGVVHTSDDVLSGEAWERGPVVLSWIDVKASGRGDGFNVVAHEFAHKLDALDGAINGIPPLHTEMPPAAWTSAFEDAYAHLLRQLEEGESPWLDPYAAENPGEFFAVCVEMFFEVPQDMRAALPAVYRQLSLWFRQDPAAQ